MTIDLNEDAVAEGSEERCADFNFDAKHVSPKNDGNGAMDCSASMKEENDGCMKEEESGSGSGNVENHVCKKEEKSGGDNEDEKSANLEEENHLEEQNPFPGSVLLQIEKSLEVGSEVKGLDQAYILYCEYARLMGFSVKKGQQNYFRRCSEIKMKLYLCSCEGFPEQKCSESKIGAYRKQMWRTNCKARLRVTRRKDGPWTVSCFHKDHNHELLAADQSYLLRSARHLSHAKLSVLAALNSAGIGVTKAFRFMEKESRGIENVGFIRKDAYNSIGRVRRESKIQHVDAQRLLQFFDQKCSEDPLFRWSVQLDDDGRLLNFFYRDARCLLDYNHFGDVLSIDTTHKTNKYKLLCAPFVGLNHHKHNIMFGVAFLSDETTASFEWLFSTFLTHMEMKEPEVIFSDEAQALINGIDYTFQSAKHRLCQWHINQNSVTHFGKLNGDEEFKRSWYHCMNLCETEEEFEECWSKMIEKYNLSGESWFRKMYNIKRRWSSVFSIDRFSAGLHATSRSEGTNNALKALCSSSTCLYDFVMQYEQVQLEWRNRERAEDARCLGVPGQIVMNNPLLMHAAHVYTRRVYDWFEKVFTEASNVYMSVHPADYKDEELVFVVRVNGQRKSRRVTVRRSSNELECSCCKFVTDGILCNHIINIMLLLNIRKIPEAYILKRWTKRAKVKMNVPSLGSLKSGDGGVIVDMVFVNHVMRVAYDIALSCKEESHRRDVNDCLGQLKVRISPDTEIPSPLVKWKGRNRYVKKVNGKTVRNPTLPKPKGARGSPQNEEKVQSRSKKNGTKSRKKKKDENPRKRKRVEEKAINDMSEQIEDLNGSTGDIGLDLFPSQPFSSNLGSLPLNGNMAEVDVEALRMTL